MKSFFKKRRRPEKHLRKTSKGFATVNPDISYDYVSGMQVDRSYNSKINDGLKQEANSAMRELQQAVAEQEAKKQAELERQETARRKKEEAQIQKLIDMKSKCEREASREAANQFGMKAEANFDPETLEVEFMTPDKYDLDPREPTYSEIMMSGHVLLGSGENKIRLEVSAESFEREYSETTSKTKYYYRYNQTTVTDPKSLYDAIENEKN